MNRTLMRAAFGVSWLMTSVMAVLSVVATQAGSAHQSHAGVFFIYVLGWSVMFGLAGGLPRLIAADTDTAVSSGFIGYAVGGAAAGGLVALTIVTDHLGGSPGVLLLEIVFPFSVPWIFGSVFSALIVNLRAR